MGKNPRKIQQGHANLEWGHHTEEITSEYFIKEGYVIREKNWRCGRLEIDLILEKDGTIIFVEVKARRPGTEDPVEAVDMKKIMRIVNAADIYLQMQTFRYEYQFDIVTFTGTPEDYEMVHYPDAFVAPVNGGRR